MSEADNNSNAPERVYPSVNIEDEMKQSYMDYAMSVIVGRALPDVRDGLKPVHRRVLYAMYEMGNDWNRKHQKSSRVVGEVMGKYHPHGDSAIYDTMVRMAQDFSQRYVLIDGQGNFGSVDGDTAAASRYTEVRMARLAHELLLDIDKETVDFIPNYDGVEREPCVLPTGLPNLLINGSSGIAVGMATNIPPHNLGEVLDACLYLLDYPDATINRLIELVPGPDFPTFGIINGTAGIHEAYHTGRGRIRVRARCHIETDASGNEAIVVTELPFQVNKALLQMKLAELVKQKKLTGIRDLRDESDREGMRLVIMLRRGEMSEIVLNNLYKQTAMQSVFGINLVALSGNRPRQFSLKDMLAAFLDHRREVVTRRSLFELRKARARAHLLEGLAIALVNIDSVVSLIRGSRVPAEARQALMEKHWPPGMVVEMLARAGDISTQPEDMEEGCGMTESGYRLSPAQAQAILELRLQKLTGLEREKIIEEFGSLLDAIVELQQILSDQMRLEQVIREELQRLKGRYADPRRTEINSDQEDLEQADLIPEAEMVVTLSHAGYVKAQPLDAYRSQRRGGKGKLATTTRAEDFIVRLYIASTHDAILCFSSLGKVYWIERVYQLPQAGRHARGKPIINLLPLSEGERISAILPIREYTADRYLFMATANGTIKKTALQAYSRPRSSGLRAIHLGEGDRLIGVELTDGGQDVMLFSNAGKVVRFSESRVRSTGRISKGVRGMRLSKGQRIISLIVVERDKHVLTATWNGFGKCTLASEYPSHGRGGKGVIAIRTGERNGDLMGAIAVEKGDEVILISNQGTLIRSPVSDISVVGRNTQGVRLLRLNEGEHLVGIERISDAGD